MVTNKRRLPIVGAYWGRREESREACAQRVVAYLDALDRRDPEYARWHRKEAPPSPQLPRDVHALLDWFSQVSDDDGHLLAQLGFWLSAWRRQADPPITHADLRVVLGAFDSQGNSCLVSFGTEVEMSDEIGHAFVHAAVEAFDPDHVIYRAGETLGSAHAACRESNACGQVPPVYAPPSLYRYQRGFGFSANTAVQPFDRHLDPG